MELLYVSRSVPPTPLVLALSDAGGANGAPRSS